MLLSRVFRCGGVFVAAAVMSACSSVQPMLPQTISGPPQSLAGAPISVSENEAKMALRARILSYHLMPLRRSQPNALTGNRKIVYPADLVYKGGPIVSKAASYNVYVNCKRGGESCWGDPEGFQKNLTGSRFAQLLEQYTKSPPSSYTLGNTFAVKCSTYTNSSTKTTC